MLSWKLKIVLVLGCLLSGGLMVAALYLYSLSGDPIPGETGDASDPKSSITAGSVRSATGEAKRTASRLGVLPRTTMPVAPGSGTTARPPSIKGTVDKVKKTIAPSAKPAPSASSAPPPDAVSAPPPPPPPAPSAAVPPTDDGAKAEPAPEYRAAKPLALVPPSVLEQGRRPAPPPDLVRPDAEPTAPAPADPLADQDRVVFSLQSGVFASAVRAVRLQDAIMAAGTAAEIYTQIDDDGQTWYSVGVGNYRSYALADMAARDFRRRHARQVRIMVFRASEVEKNQPPTDGPAKVGETKP